MLKTKIGEIELKNPVIAASEPFVLEENFLR